MVDLASEAAVAFTHMTATDPESDSNALGIGFMRTEISMGLAFAKIASDAGTRSTEARLQPMNAQKAHDTLCRFLPRLVLTNDEVAELHGGLERLRLAMAAI